MTFVFFFLGERIEDGKKNLKAYDMKLYKILGGHEIGGVVSVIYIYIWYANLNAKITRYHWDPHTKSWIKK